MNMTIALVAQKFDTYSTARLVQEMKTRGHAVVLLSPLATSVKLSSNSHKVIHEGNEVTVDAVLLRCASYTTFGVTIVRLQEIAIGLQFQYQGAICVNDPIAKFIAHNKFISLQVLHHAGIPVPSTFLTWDDLETRTHIFSELGLPLVIKIIEGTWGMGVMRVDTQESANSVMDALRGTGRHFLIQEYFRESKGTDIRALVVGGQVVASMKRVAPPGEFRSNIHHGGRSEKVELDTAYEELAIRSARALGLDIAGIDILETKRGPVVLEVNPTPGLESIENITATNIAGTIIEYLESKAKARRST